MEIVKKINSLNAINVGGNDKFVRLVYWQIIGTKSVNEKLYTSSVRGTKEWDIPIEYADMIPYDKLTEDIVFGWLNLDINGITDIIEKQLEEQINPKILTIINPFNTLQNEDSILQPTT